MDIRFPSGGAGTATDIDRNCKQLRDRQRIQKWLKLRVPPSERFTKGLISMIGRTVLELGARGRMQGLAILAGPAIADAIDVAAEAFAKEYVRLVGSIYR